MPALVSVSTELEVHTAHSQWKGAALHPKVNLGIQLETSQGVLQLRQGQALPLRKTISTQN